jgi:hypothetical protein
LAAEPRRLVREIIAAFFRYFYAEAPRQADELGYVALPPAAVEAVESRWASPFEQNS